MLVVLRRQPPVFASSAAVCGAFTLEALIMSLQGIWMLLSLSSLLSAGSEQGGACPRPGPKSDVPRDHSAQEVLSLLQTGTSTCQALKHL